MVIEQLDAAKEVDYMGHRLFAASVDTDIVSVLVAALRLEAAVSAPAAVLELPNNHLLR